MKSEEGDADMMVNQDLVKELSLEEAEMVKQDLDNANEKVNDSVLEANGVSNSVDPEYQKGVVIDQTFNEYQGMPDEVEANDQEVNGTS
jgi:hypothetical protein